MRIYANLLGNWTDITETGTVADCQNPVTYFTENLTFLEALPLPNVLNMDTYTFNTKVTTIAYIHL